MEHASSKATNISLTQGPWAEIAGNKFFEAGAEGLLLDQVSRSIIHNNYFAWPGQRVESDAIRVVGVPVAGDHYGFLDIHDNLIVEPTGNGISIDANGGRSQIHDNNIWHPGRGDRYYGSASLSDSQKAVKVENDSLNVVVSNNLAIQKNSDVALGNNVNMAQNNYFDPHDGTNIRKDSDLYVLTQISGSILDFTKYDVVHLNYGAATSITEFQNNGRYKIVVIKSFSGKETIVNDINKIVLKNAQNVTIPQNGGVMTFLVTGSGFANEVSRSF